MTDNDDLLAQADNDSLFIVAATNGISPPLTYKQAVDSLKHAGQTIEELAEALRAAKAELTVMRGLHTGAVDAVKDLRAGLATLRAERAGDDHP